MKKVFAIIIVALVFAACSSEPKKELKVDGDWEFQSFIEGETKLNPQSQAMVKSILKMFKDGEVSFKDGNIEINSPGIGKRSGTFSVEDGKISAKLGENSQFVLHASNQEETLVILFNEFGEKETGKIVMAKK